VSRFRLRGTRAPLRLCLNIPPTFQWHDVGAPAPAAAAVIRQSVSRQRGRPGCRARAHSLVASARSYWPGAAPDGAEGTRGLLDFARRIGAPVGDDASGAELFAERAGGPRALRHAARTRDRPSSARRTAGRLRFRPQNRWTTGVVPAEGARVVQVDLDPAALNHHRVVDARVSATRPVSQRVRAPARRGVVHATGFRRRTAHLSGTSWGRKPASTGPDARHR